MTSQSWGVWSVILWKRRPNRCGRIVPGRPDLRRFWDPALLPHEFVACPCGRLLGWRAFVDEKHILACLAVVRDPHRAVITLSRHRHTIALGAKERVSMSRVAGPFEAIGACGSERIVHGGTPVRLERHATSWGGAVVRKHGPFNAIAAIRSTQCSSCRCWVGGNDVVEVRKRKIHCSAGLRASYSKKNEG